MEGAQKGRKVRALQLLSLTPSSYFFHEPLELTSRKKLSPGRRCRQVNSIAVFKAVTSLQAKNRIRKLRCRIKQATKPPPTFDGSSAQFCCALLDDVDIRPFCRAYNVQILVAKWTRNQNRSSQYWFLFGSAGH